MYRRFLFAVVVSFAAVSPGSAQNSLKEDDLQRIKSATVFIKVLAGKAGGTGSGFLVKVDGETGYLVTNDHVIKLGYRVDEETAQSAKVEVVFDSGTAKERTVPAQTVAADPDRDLAVLKVEKVKDLPAPLDYATTPKMFETMPVFVCGFPFGGRLAEGNKNPEISIGGSTISSIRSEVVGGPISVVQINGALNPGNSGGPIVTAEAKLVGVAVRTLPGAGIGQAVPQHEVAALMRGRVGRVLLLPGIANGEVKDDLPPKLDVMLLDPLSVVKGVTAHVLSASKPLPKTPVPPGPIPDAMKVPLKIAADHATAEVAAPDARKGIIVQLELETADGKVFTNAITVPLSPTGPGRINPRPTMPSDPNGPQRTPEGRLKLANGVVLPFPSDKFPTPSGSESVSNVNATPDAFVGKAIKLDAISNCVVNPTDKNEFELAVVTDTDNPPADVRVVLPKDLALQIADLGIPELTRIVLEVKFPVRIAGKLAKPAGRERRYTFAAESIEFLDEDGKSVVSFKPDAKAPDGKPTLATLNRFPEKFVGQTLTLDALVKGTRNWGGTSIDLVSQTQAPPMNLEIYTSRSLAGQVDSDIRKEDLPARARVTVEVKAINGKTQKGVVGVKQLELIGEDDKAVKTLKTSAAVEYPTIPAAVKSPPPPPKPADTAKTDEKAEQPAAVAKPPTAGGDNTMLIVALVGAVVLVVGGGFVLLMALRKPKAEAVAANPVEEEEAKPVRQKPVFKEAPPLKAARTGNTTARTKPAAPKPAAPPDDNPFANFG